MSKFSVTPFPGNILLVETKIEDKSEGGIIMPTETIKQNPHALVAEVIAVGEGVEGVEKGDIIGAHKGRCTQYNFPLITYWIAKKEDLLGKIIKK
jgi:co-chaperonin GroES (HSP10)